MRDSRGFIVGSRITVYLLNWHLSPLDPGRQLHVHLFMPSAQIPPLRQGLDPHSLKSVKNQITEGLMRVRKYPWNGSSLLLTYHLWSLQYGEFDLEEVKGNRREFSQFVKTKVEHKSQMILEECLAVVRHCIKQNVFIQHTRPEFPSSTWPVIFQMMSDFLRKSI